MAVKYGGFEMPTTIKVDEESKDKSFARYLLEPFERGYAHTIGNAVRRVMFTSIESPAIVSVRIEGVAHEYMAIDGVIEDMTNIILNFKGALLRKHAMEDDPLAREARILTTVVNVTQEDIDRNKGHFVVTLGDVVKEGNFEVVNPKLQLFTVTKPFHRQIDVRVQIGRGYVPTERLQIADKAADEILIDASFSPVRQVNYFVENTRVGQDTDFDKLIIEVTTDGRVTATEALTFASQIAVKHFDVFSRIKTLDLTFDSGDDDFDEGSDALIDKLCLRIDEIELSVRSTNCLSGANIETIAELVSIPERRMLEFRNFGKKSLNEIKAKLHEMGLGLGMDLARYGITSDNVKDKIVQIAAERKKDLTEFSTVEETTGD